AARAPAPHLSNDPPVREWRTSLKHFLLDQCDRIALETFDGDEGSGIQDEAHQKFRRQKLRRRPATGRRPTGNRRGTRARERVRRATWRISSGVISPCWRS